MKIRLLALTLFFAGSANAIVSGTDVSESNYQDFVVRLNVNGNGCAGSLVGGDYIVTARHCIMPISGANAGTLYGNSVTVSQGVKLSTALTYTRTFTYLTSASFDTEKETVASDIYDNVVVPSYPLGGAGYNGTDYVDDVVILKLSSPISHTTGALLSPVYDYDTDTTLLPKNTSLTFRGWGYTDEANTTLADTMQQSPMELFFDYIEADDDSINLDSTYGYLSASCVDMAFSGCQWHDKDYTIIYSTGAGYTKPGDSGSPIVYNNKIFGVLSKTNEIYQHQSQMSDFTLLMGVFANYFDKILYPYAPGKHITKGSTNNYTITIPVQNFTSNAVLFTPVLNDSTGYFTLDASDCDGTIASKQSCIMTVEFNSNNLSVMESKSASIYMTTDVTIPVVVDFSSTTGSSSPGDDSASSGGSGGGSFGMFSLLGMLGAIVFRKRYGK
jgi:hypothetical protein